MTIVNQILTAIKDGCNTTRDLADVTGLSVVTCASAVKDLVKAGRLKQTGREIRRDVPGRRFKVFEPSDAHATYSARNYPL